VIAEGRKLKRFLRGKKDKCRRKQEASTSKNEI